MVDMLVNVLRSDRRVGSEAMHEGTSTSSIVPRVKDEIDATDLLLVIRHGTPDGSDLPQDLGVGELGIRLSELRADVVLELDVGRGRPLGRVRILDLLLLLGLGRRLGRLIVL